MPDDDAPGLRPIRSTNWREHLNDPQCHRATWRLVAAHVLGVWRWAVLRAWFRADDGWFCYLEWGDNQVRGGSMGGWYVYDERWVRRIDPLPDHWEPPDP